METAILEKPKQTIDEQIKELMDKPVPVLETQFVISSAILHRHTKALHSLISSNPIVPILENFCFSVTNGGELFLTSSDLYNTLHCLLPVEIIGVKPAAGIPVRFCITAKKLHKLLTGLSEQPITITFDGKSKATITTETGNVYNFCAESGLDYPKLPTVENPKSFDTDGVELADVFRKTLPYTSNDDLRPAMTGIRFDHCKFAATDGHRLIRLETPSIICDAAFILSKRAASVFLKAYDKSTDRVNVALSDQRICFTWANFQLFGRIIDERFPDYENAIPYHNDNLAVINRQALIRLVSRVIIFANQTTKQMQFAFDNGKLTVYAEDLDWSNDCTETMHIQTDGDPLTIGFNAGLLIDTLKALPETHVQFTMSAPNRAAILYPHNGDPNKKHLALIMPVMLNTYA